MRAFYGYSDDWDDAAFSGALTRNRHEGGLRRKDRRPTPKFAYGPGDSWDDDWDDYDDYDDDYSDYDEDEFDSYALQR